MTTKAQLGEVLDSFLTDGENRPKRTRRTHFIGAHVTERLKKELEDEAAIEDVSMSALVAKILSNALRYRKQRRRDKFTQPADGIKILKGH